MIFPHRFTVFLVGGVILVLVSSFSTLHPTSCQNREGRNVALLLNDAMPKNSLVQLPRRQIFSRTIKSGTSFVLSMSSTPTTAEDSKEVRELFSKYCDQDSLIDRKTLESMPPFGGLLADEDLLPVELDDIWEAAPKTSKDSSRVDVDAFVQIYRDVDDLFEDEEEEEDEVNDKNDFNAPETDATTVKFDDNALENELLKAYQSLCDENGLISKDELKQWEEIESLLQEGLLGEDEFDELWANSLEGENSSVDANGFMTFNFGLDDLFVSDDDEEDDVEDDEQDEAPAVQSTSRAMVIEGDMPPGVLFSQLADANYVVGMNELKLWAELKDLLDDGELLESELQEIFEKFATPEGKLTEDVFLQLYDEIDALFEEEEVNDDNNAEKVAISSNAQQQQQSQAMSAKVKGDFLSYIGIVIEEDEGPCGFGASDSDHEQIVNILTVLEQQQTNILSKKDIEQADLAGVWELIYTSSSAMKFNKGLSGIGGSFPNGRFGGLRQELKSTKFLSDMEYKERIDVTPSSASFDVTINGIWDLQKSVSLFSGQPTVILNVTPDKVSYGPTSTRADHWKSLGPVNKLDLSYLDDDLRVMRG